MWQLLYWCCWFVYEYCMCQAVVKADCTKAKVQKSTGIRKALLTILEPGISAGLIGLPVHSQHCRTLTSWLPGLLLPSTEGVGTSRIWLWPREQSIYQRNNELYMKGNSHQKQKWESLLKRDKGEKDKWLQPLKNIKIEKQKYINLHIVDWYVCVCVHIPIYIYIHI